MFIIRHTGDWGPDEVLVRSAPSRRVVHPEVERAIEQAWERESARLGDKLFDGPMCRLENIVASPRRLELTLSPTSYKPFLGTNLHNASLADRFGADVLANPVGLSTALQTADNWLLLGRRNDSVAYYPNRVHPLAGALEPHDPTDVFAEVRRELREELSFTPADIADLRCIGLIEDRALRQPELIFAARSTLPRNVIDLRLDSAEHAGTFALPAQPDAIARILADTLLTPVAAGALTLWVNRQSGRR